MRVIPLRQQIVRTGGGILRCAKSSVATLFLFICAKTIYYYLFLASILPTDYRVLRSFGTTRRCTSRGAKLASIVTIFYLSFQIFIIMTGRINPFALIQVSSLDSSDTEYAKSPRSQFVGTCMNCNFTFRLASSFSTDFCTKGWSLIFANV